MKKRFLALLVLLLVNSVFAEEWVHNSESLEISVDIAGSMDVIPESSTYSVKSVTANLTFFPRDYFNQEVLYLEIEPEGEITNNSIKFEWTDPTEKRLSFGFNSRVKNYNKIVEIKDKIDFPIKDLSSELEIYTKPSSTIDSDKKEIVKLASELVKGEDDLYKAVFKLADWTKNNVKYDLSTLTADVSQKASWVLENREGVCDEIASLFIALCRAVGIPARFVSGIAYTNSPLFEEEWGAHGWAEVYFPGYGWVPFDVTYGEFGFIDATHIKMRDSVDSASSSTQYEWLGRNVDLKTRSLEIKTELIDEKGKIEGFVELEADAIKKEVGFGSYNLIQVNVKNLKEHYLATEIYLSKTEGIEIIGENKKSVLLKPKEEKRVFWVIKVDGNLGKGYIYTFPFIVSSLRDSIAAVSFNSENRDIVYSLEEIENILKDKKEEEEKKYSREVNLDCDIDKEEFYTYEDALIKCYLKNTGNVFLDNLNVCFEDECYKFDLGIMQDRSLNFSVNYSKAGQKDIPVKARNYEVSKFEYVNFNILDEPELKITNLEHPKEVNFDDVYEVVFVLEKISKSNPVDIEVVFEQNGFEKEWLMNELFEDRKYVINLQGSNLKAGRNDFKIFVNYKDGNNREYETEEEFFIELVNVNLWQHIRIFFNELGKFIMGLSFGSLAITLFIVGFMFAFVVLYVFHSRKNRPI